MIRTLSPLPNAPGVTAPLDEWLRWLETIHPVAIDMGLDRVSQVAHRLALHPLDKPLVLVGGTNGKGSTVAMLTAIYVAAGYRVGSYTSPHIDDFRERICINGDMAEAADIVAALAWVEAQREPETLTYFEYTTLAAMRVFQRAQCDVYVLEVGLGGRLDASNLWDADCSVVTSIALDHEAYLGSDLRVIATEKAAIGRPGKPLIVGEPEPPNSLFEYAREQGIELQHIGKAPTDSLPLTALSGAHQRRNAGCAVAVVDALQSVLPVSQETCQLALMSTSVKARFERIEREGVNLVLDVAHNPAGAQALLSTWREHYGDLKADVIFAALSDKDLDGIVVALEPLVATWHCIEPSVPRATSLSALQAVLTTHSQKPICLHSSGALEAWCCARESARSMQRPVLVAGSFHTIAEVNEIFVQLDGESP